MDDTTSEKNEDASASACGRKVRHPPLVSQSARSRRSASRRTPFDEQYARAAQSVGWNSAAMITSESSSMSAGLRSAMLYACCAVLTFQMWMRRSSADRYVSPSALNDSELMW